MMLMKLTVGCFGSFFYVHVTREKLAKQRSYENFVSKMLMKLTTSWVPNLHCTVWIEFVNRASLHDFVELFVGHEARD